MRETGRGRGFVRLDEASRSFKSGKGPGLFGVVGTGGTFALASPTVFETRNGNDGPREALAGDEGAGGGVEGGGGALELRSAPTRARLGGCMSGVMSIASS